jgi:DNA-binding transcriptional ArsR family regulator
MPFEVDEDPERPPPVEVRLSAVLELTWLLNALHRRYDETAYEWLENAAPALREELAGLWEDGFGCEAEVSILAERIGALLSEEADTFLDGLARATQLDGAGLELRSETRQDREATLARLERLRGDPELTRRYAGVLREVWELARPTWERKGLAEVRRAAADWSERLRQGASVQDLLPGRHLAHRPDLAALLRQRPRVVVTPMYFVIAGGFIVDMTSYVHVGGPARGPNAEEVRRKASDVIATRMKVLADATRVALLRELAHEPASVMDLARRFRLAQPTVSNHVRMLRDAGLLESRKDGPRIVYSVPRDQLGRMLDDTRDLLLS